MKQFLLTFAAVILAAFLLFMIPLIIISAIATASMSSENTEVRKGTVITLDISEPLADRDMDSPSYRVRNALSGAHAAHGLNTLCDNLDAAADDDNVVALYVKGAGVGANLANARALRKAIADFKARSGKPVYYFDNSIASCAALYVATAADSVFVAQEGMVGMEGPVVSKLFYKGLADKLGVSFDIIKHGKYKSAVEPFFRDSMSPEDKAQNQRIVDVVWNEMRDTITAARHIAPADLDNFIDNLDYIAGNCQPAVKLGLIDGGRYYDQVEESLRSVAGIAPDEELDLLNIYDYSGSSSSSASDKVAVVYAEGQIFDGVSEDDEANIYGDDLAATIRELRKDKDVKAIVMRVNSPGGSALASDVVWREVKLAKAEKPFIVSMGGYAASGGYYISCAADYIYAEPTTITGSIGVYGMIPNVEKAAENVGIGFDYVGSSKKTVITGIKALDPAVMAALQRSVEDTYGTFVNHVSEGRGKTYAEIDSIAQGRVWMGYDALALGLVDALGNIDDAIDYAAETAGLEDYEVVDYPEVDDSPFAILKQMGLSARLGLGHMLIGQEFDYFNKMKGQLQSEPTKVWAICDVDVK